MIIVNWNFDFSWFWRHFVGNFMYILNIINCMTCYISFVERNMPNYCMTVDRGIFSNDPIFVLHVQNLKHSWFYSISRHIPKCEFFLEKSAKNFKLHNIVKTYSGIQKMCPTRRWKASTSYFSAQLVLGTIMLHMVPTNTHMLSIQTWIGLKEIILNYLGFGNKCWPKVLLWKCPPLRLLFASIWPQNNICHSQRYFGKEHFTKNHFVQKD